MSNLHARSGSRRRELARSRPRPRGNSAASGRAGSRERKPGLARAARWVRPLPDPGAARGERTDQDTPARGLGGATRVHLGTDLSQSSGAPVLSLVEDPVALALTGALIVGVVGAFPEGVGDDRILELVRDRPER